MCKLRQEGEKIDDSYRKKWERDIGRPIERKLWSRANAYISEAYVKVRNWWYLVPIRLQKMFPEMDSNLRERGSMTHIWWSCPKVKAFWEAVYHEIATKMDIPMEFTPENYLLHLLDGLGRLEVILLNNLLVKNGNENALRTFHSVSAKYISYCNIVKPTYNLEQAVLETY